MSTSNGHTNGTVRRAAVTVARPVVLVRYRTGITGKTARTVHLMALPGGGQAGAASSLFFAALRTALHEPPPAASLHC